MSASSAYKIQEPLTKRRCCDIVSPLQSLLHCNQSVLQVLLRLLHLLLRSLHIPDQRLQAFPQQ